MRILAEQTAQLPDAETAAVTARVLPRAAAQTPGKLRQSVRRAVARTDPDALRRRAEAAARERGVWLHKLPDGMALLSACLAGPDAVGVHAVLDHHARTTGRGTADCAAGGGDAAGDDRTLDARRADALVDLVCGPLVVAAARSQRGPLWRRDVTVQVRVTVPFSTLFGLAEHPGELTGYRPLTTDQVRELAAYGAWRRILTDPATGDPGDFGTTATGPQPRSATRSRPPDPSANTPAAPVPPPATSTTTNHTTAAVRPRSPAPGPTAAATTA